MIKRLKCDIANNARNDKFNLGPAAASCFLYLKYACMFYICIISSTMVSPNVGKREKEAKKNCFFFLLRSCRRRSWVVLPSSPNRSPRAMSFFFKNKLTGRKPRKSEEARAQGEREMAPCVLNLCAAAGCAPAASWSLRRYCLPDWLDCWWLLMLLSPVIQPFRFLAVFA